MNVVKFSRTPIFKVKQQLKLVNMKIAVEGCAHGELEKIYECIETLQEREGMSIDLLICCGDFQSVRNKDDLRAMAVPEKYQHICTFYKYGHVCLIAARTAPHMYYKEHRRSRGYYSGEKKAPVLTIFIGGNHEASNYLQELPYGGWVAPNIYYMGRAGVIKFGNLRIGGLSGIFKGRDYLQGLWECPPYNQNSLRSVYHIRALDVFRLSQLKEKVHVILSHDWPQGITDYGDKEELLRKKQFLREDIESNQLGSPPATKLLNELKPDYWFAAHLHCKFAALVKHEENETKFLALDKCLPKRRHLQILDLPAEYDGDKQLKFDVEWLAVLKNTNHLMSVKNVESHMPGPGGNERYDFTPTTEEKDAVINLMEDMLIKEGNFVMTAPVYDPNSRRGFPGEPVANPQTGNLCEKLGIDDPLQVLTARTGRTLRQPNVITPSPGNVVTSPEPVANPIATPVKSKMSLPAPMTPSDYDEMSHTNSLFSPETPTQLNSTNECTTPVSVGKKTFKRRNQSLYTPDVDDSADTSTSLLDESPRSSKVSFKENNTCS